MNPTTQAAIDLSPIVNDLIQGAGIVLLALGSVAAGYIAQHFKNLNQAQVQAVLHDATDRAISYATAKTNELEADGKLSIPVKDQTTAGAVNYLIQSMPGTIKKLGYSGDDLQRLVEAKVAQAAGVALPPTLAPAVTSAPADPAATPKA